jgi:hypothetical protein
MILTVPRLGASAILCLGNKAARDLSWSSIVMRASDMDFGTAVWGMI